MWKLKQKDFLQQVITGYLQVITSWFWLFNYVQNEIVQKYLVVQLNHEHWAIGILLDK